MLAQWLEDDGDDGNITPQQEDKGLARNAVDGTPDEYITLHPVVGSTTSPPAMFERLTQTFILDSASNSAQAGATATCVCIVDSNADGVINRHDFRVEYNRARGSGGVLKSVTYSVSGASVSLKIVIDGTTVTVADEPNTTDIDESVTQGDHVRIRYSTEPTIKYLIDTQLQTRGLLADDNGYVNPQDLHNAFDDLSDDDRTNLRGKEARNFEDNP